MANVNDTVQSYIAMWNEPDAQAQFPGLSFRLAAGPEAHQNRARFSWSLGPASGETIVAGTDFVTLSEDGRMRSITGFVDVAP